MFDMQALKFLEQRSIATKFGFIEVPSTVSQSDQGMQCQGKIGRKSGIYMQFVAMRPRILSSILTLQCALQHFVTQ